MDETIKMYNAKNLKEAKRQAEEEKANLEVMRAKQVYKSLINTKEMHEREIKIRQEEIKKLELELAVFDKKQASPTFLGGLAESGQMLDTNRRWFDKFV